MRKYLVFLALSFLPKVGLSQISKSLDNSLSAYIKSCGVLADKGYTFDKIRTDTTLLFEPDDSLRPYATTHYWLKVIVANPSHYDEPYRLGVKPVLDNTVYYFDRDSQRWVSYREGLMVPYTGRRNRAKRSIMVRGQAETVVYVQVDVHLLRQFGKDLKLKIDLEKKTVIDNREQFIFMSWIASLSILFLFFLNNLFIYFKFNDKIVLYYLIAQIGGMIYVTDYKDFLSTLLPWPVFTIGMALDGQIHSFSLCDLCQHLSIMLILYGYVKMTRAYLNTSTSLPRLDFVLRYGLVIYLSLSILLVAISMLVVYIEYNILLYYNILAFLLIGAIICSCMLGYVRKLPAATPFLLANILPLLLMLTIALLHVFATNYKAESSLVPDLATVSHALTFSVALVARTKFIQDELTLKTVETQKLAYEIREMELRNKLTELENQKINADIRQEKNRNELLQQRLETNQRELASTTMYIVQKNELLAGLKAQLVQLNKQYPNGNQQSLKSIESILKSNFYLDADWEKFKVHFEQVHPNFFENLLAKHPSLTKYEIRLYAYFHINLSTKEIAALLNIDPASVRRAKTRLYKKMTIPEPGN